MTTSEFSFDEEGNKYIQLEEAIGACSANYHKYCKGYLKDTKRFGFKCGCKCHKEEENK